jgi:Cu(I)/Ag(I) efflux system membrane protein CusA/SilA
MGIRIKGPDLETIERAGISLETLLKKGEVPGVDTASVFADRIVGKPYLEIVIDRKAAARYGIKVHMIQSVIRAAVGGEAVTMTVEGRERYPVRVRYLRELRDSPGELQRILIPAPDGTQVPLSQIAGIEYVRGPQVIKSEDGFLIGYVIFDKKQGYAEVDTVERVRKYLDAQEAEGRWDRMGTEITFTGNYQNQIRAQRRLSVVLPLALLIIFFILYLQFRSPGVSMLVFSGILLAWAGGFIMLWFYSRPSFLDFSLFGENMRDLFQVHPHNLSVAVWVGFLAVFGIASDNGVVITAYLNQVFEKRDIRTKAEIRDAVLEAGMRRVRPCLMTTATTVLALIPVLTSTGRGSDIMVPMALPSFGGMIMTLLSLVMVPLLYAMMKERALDRENERTENN